MKNILKTLILVPFCFLAVACGQATNPNGTQVSDQGTLTDGNLPGGNDHTQADTGPEIAVETTDQAHAPSDDGDSVDVVQVNPCEKLPELCDGIQEKKPKLPGDGLQVQAVNSL